MSIFLSIVYILSSNLKPKIGNICQAEFNKLMMATGANQECSWVVS